MTFEPGVTSAFVPLVAISDGLYEGMDESVVVFGRSGERTIVNGTSSGIAWNIVDTDSKLVTYRP